MTEREAKAAIYVTLPLSTVMLAASVFLSFSRSRSGDEHYRQVDLFTKTLKYLEDHYVEEVDTWEVVYDGLAAMAERDAYSTFYDPEQARRFTEETHREYHGVGFSVNLNSRPLRIDFLFEGSPAEKAGLRPGDEILAVNDRLIDDFEPGEATSAIKGPLGTKVKLRVRVKETGEERDFQVARAKIAQPTVFTEHYQDQHGKVAYIRVDGFGEHTAEEFDRALRAVLDAGSDGLVLDLRHNQGGLVPSCQHVANRLLRDGLIVCIRHRTEEGTKYSANPDECWAPDLPLVVLVNGETASAAEILAGALQDHGRALLVGERTYGKGVVQSIYMITLDTDEKEQAVLKMTTGVYLTPSGRIIEKSVKSKTPARGGLGPDVTIRLDEETQQSLYRRFSLLSIPRASRDHYLRAYELEIPEVEDRQLVAALKVLRGETVSQDL